MGDTQVNKTAKTAKKPNKRKGICFTQAEKVANIRYVAAQEKTNTNDAKTAPKVCFSYVRFSSRIQAKGDSERRQLEIAPRVAQEKGWTLREDLNAFDLGLSAYHKQNLGEKGSIQSILAAVRSGKIPQGSVMIIEAFDRLTRADIDEAMPLLWQLLGTGLELYIDRTSRHLTKSSLKDPLELTFALFELKGAHEHSAKLSSRVGSAWKQKKTLSAEGIKMGRMVPAWIDCVESKTHKDKKGKPLIEGFKPNDNADTVRRIFKSYANGKGIRTIMKELNGENVPTFGKGRQNSEGKWSSTHLRRILGYRQVIGEYQPCKLVRDNNGKKEREPVGEPIADYYPEVVDKATFYKVQQILEKGNRVGGRKSGATNLFTGYIQCVCGAPMHIIHKPKKGGKYNYVNLKCSKAIRNAGCAHTRQIRYPWIERAVLSTLWVKVLPAMAENDTRKDELAKLQGELTDVKTQRKNWGDLIDKTLKANPQNVPADALLKLNSYETRQAALERQIESFSATASDNPLSNWQPISPTIENRLRLQSILANEIESITVDTEKDKATLTLKEIKGRNPQFELKWKRSGANHMMKERADLEFYLNGERETYLDDVLIWKSSRNIAKAGDKIIAGVVDSDKPFLFGVETSPNTVAILVPEVALRMLQSC